MSTASDKRQSEREGDHGGVDRHLRALRRRLEAERGERSNAGVAQPEAERAAGERQQQRFGEQLAGDPAEPRAERVARRQLLHARARAHEHQVRDVHGADQQHEHDAAPEQVQRAAQVLHEEVLQRQHDGVEPGVDQDLFQLRARDRGCACSARRSAAAPARSSRRLSTARCTTSCCCAAVRRTSAPR